jgi:hypothetical protein
LEVIKYVSEASAKKALEMERKFQALPKAAGILFVGIKAQPVKSGLDSEIFTVALGISKKIGCDAGMIIIRKVLENEIKAGLVFETKVFCGVSGAARDEGNEGAGQASA